MENQTVTVRVPREDYDALQSALRNGEIDSISDELRKLIRWRLKSMQIKRELTPEQVLKMSMTEANDRIKQADKASREKLKSNLNALDGEWPALFLAISETYRDLLNSLLLANEDHAHE